MINNIEQFENSGLARLSDLDNNLYRDLFTKLEKDQNIFFEKLESVTIDDYFKKWPKDTLHWWSRIWEYPYVFYHINKIIESKKSENLKILDFGCGVNFFPLSVSGLGHEVICVDNDTKCINSLLNFKNKFPEYQLVPLLNDGIKISLPEKSIDILYSVSVFEHVPQLNLLIEEIFRVLKDDGILVITFDISLNNIHDLKIESYKEFIRVLFARFILLYQYKPLHPNEIMTSRNSPYSYNNFKMKPSIASALKNYLVRPLLLKKPNRSPQLFLAVEGMVLSKSE